MTNFEKIKKMTVEELDEVFGEALCIHIQGYDVYHCEEQNDCENCVKKWLNKEAKE